MGKWRLRWAPGNEWRRERSTTNGVYCGDTLCSRDCEPISATGNLRINGTEIRWPDQITDNILAPSAYAGAITNIRRLFLVGSSDTI